MTLATTCPYCKTSFRVVADQLKLRKGLVRCGRCQQVFSGVDALTYLDEAGEAQQAQEQAAEPPLSVSGPASSADVAVPALGPDLAAPESVPSWAVPDVDTAAGSPPRSRVDRITILFVVLACLGGLGQALIGWRHELAYRLPALTPLMTQLAQPLGLDLHPPLDAGALTIESIQLVSAEDPNKLALEAVIRNRSDRPVAFPAIELTLRDTQSVMITRKVIPVEAYAQSLQRAAGLPARSEWPLQIALEHDGLAVAGYAAVLFHP